MGGGEQTRFVCGYLGCDARPFNPVLQALPRLMHTRGVDGVGSIAELFRLAIQETATRRAGSETVLSKVAELMFVDVVRRYIDTLPNDARGWLSGLRDANVGAALALMHARPAEPWTLEHLAREVGMSRSVLADRFMHYVREPPDALPHALAHAIGGPPSRAPGQQHRAGRGGGWLRIRGGFQSRLQEGRRRAAGRLAQEPSARVSCIIEIRHSKAPTDFRRGSEAAFATHGKCPRPRSSQEMTGPTN